MSAEISSSEVKKCIFHIYTFFHFTRWNKSHIHSKHLNILYLSISHRVVFCICFMYEPVHDKTNKMACVPSKTDHPGICPVLSESLLSVWRKLGSLATHLAHSKDWSDWVDGQSNLNLCWSEKSYCRFCLAHMELRCSVSKDTFWHVNPRKSQITCVSSQSDRSLHCPHKDTLHPWLSKMY